MREAKKLMGTIIQPLPADKLAGMYDHIQIVIVVFICHVLCSLTICIVEAPLPKDSIPAEFDSRTQWPDCITPIRDQGKW